MTHTFLTAFSLTKFIILNIILLNILSILTYYAINIIIKIYNQSIGEKIEQKLTIAWLTVQGTMRHLPVYIVKMESKNYIKQLQRTIIEIWINQQHSTKHAKQQNVTDIKNINIFWIGADNDLHCMHVQNIVLGWQHILTHSHYNVWQNACIACENFRNKTDTHNF